MNIYCELLIFTACREQSRGRGTCITRQFLPIIEEQFNGEKDNSSAENL